MKASQFTEESVRGQPGGRREGLRVWGQVGETMAEQKVPQVPEAHDVPIAGSSHPPLNGQRASERLLLGPPWEVGSVRGSTLIETVHPGQAP